ncbi:MAG: hypothetical protein NTZ80_03675 [Patescibacteria group bacterium]|nr:hypothetical protein [Patescibacteria group bacterium]
MEQDLKPENIAHPSYDIAAMSYVWIMSVFILIFKRDDEFIQYHAKQAVIFFILSLIIWPIPYIGKFLEILVVACMIFGFIQASQGVRYAFPIISQLVSGQIDLIALFKKLFKRINLNLEAIPNDDSDNADDLKMDKRGLKEDPEERDRRRRELASELGSPIRPEDL